MEQDHELFSVESNKWIINLMNILGEDGPQFMGNLSDKVDQKQIEQRKATYLKHFMLDYLEISMRQIANQNSIKCA